MLVAMDRLLIGLGLAVWAVAGSPRVARMLAEGPVALDAPWAITYLAFPPAFVAARRALDPRRGLALTVLQSLLALALLVLGMPHFEGALFALVGAQMLLVVSWPAAAMWALLQGAPLFLRVLPSHELAGAAKATGEYLAFTAFAAAAFALRERERRQRLALARVQAELLGTRALVQETAKLAEQSRIRRELHDTLGHHLAAAGAHLDAARLGVDRAQHLERARSSLDALVADSRAAIAGRPLGIDPRQALEALVDAIPGLEVRLHLDGLGDVGADASFAIFRFVQEALTNAHRHARARRVEVRGEGDRSGWTMRVSNDGAMPRGEPIPGGGLRGMRERLGALGATLRVEVGDRFVLTAEGGDTS
jgi:signal transduction histidine kinase